MCASACFSHIHPVNSSCMFQFKITKTHKQLKARSKEWNVHTKRNKNWNLIIYFFKAASCRCNVDGIILNIAECNDRYACVYRKSAIIEMIMVRLWSHSNSAQFVQMKRNSCDHSRNNNKDQFHLHCIDCVQHAHFTQGFHAYNSHRCLYGLLIFISSEKTDTNFCW